MRPTGFSGVPPPGPATPVVETATSAPSRFRTPSAIASAVSAETEQPLALEHPGRNAELSLLDRVRVGDDRPEDDVARPGHRRQSAADEPARARLGGREAISARATEVEDELLDRAFVVGEELAVEAVAQAGLESRRSGLAVRLDEEIHMDLEIARADRCLHPASVAP